MGPAIRIHRLPQQLDVEQAGHFGRWQAALKQQSARNVLNGFCLGIPVGPIGFWMDQRTETITIGLHEACFNRVTVAAKTRSLHVQCGRCGWALPGLQMHARHHGRGEGNIQANDAAKCQVFRALYHSA